MTFNDLKTELSACSGLSFTDATQRLQSLIFALDRVETVQLVSQIGAIPEDIEHDSTEEKIYTKASDILLAKSLTELNLEARVLTQRADCADIVAQSHYHQYSLVGDAKAFRLSRTAKNTKDYKVTSMVKWRGDCDYSVLVCPYFQYPKHNSQIYKEALDGNISLFSWEYIYILLKEGVKESPEVNISRLWNQSETIGKDTTVAQSKKCFLPAQNANIASFLEISEAEFYAYLGQLKSLLVNRGSTEIGYYQHEIARIMRLDRKTAIAELLKSKKLDSKIATIQGFIDQLKAENDA